MALTQEQARRAVTALHRFGLGAKPGGLSPDLARDPVGALKRETNDAAALFIEDEKLPTAQAALAKLFDEQRAVRLARETSRDEGREMRVARARSATPDATSAPAIAMAPAQQRPQGQSPAPGEQVVYRNEALARLAKSVEPAVGFGERLCLFWSNHFCVSVGKGQITRATAGALEREAIRPHVFGRFSDMLLAVEKHPAMLFYLDNRQSIGPNSRAGRNGMSA